MNTNERHVYDMVTSHGWTILRSGWPDYLIVPNIDRPFGLELKVGKDRITESQRLMHGALHIAGVPVLVLKADSEREIPILMAGLLRGRQIVRYEKLGALPNWDISVPTHGPVPVTLEDLQNAARRLEQMKSA